MFRGKAFRTFFAPFILGLSSAMIVVAATLHITDKAEEPEPDMTPEPEVETIQKELGVTRSTAEEITRTFLAFDQRMDRILQKTPKEIADQQLSFVMAGLNEDLIHHPAVGEEELLTLKVKEVLEEYQSDKEKAAGSDGNDKNKRNFFPRI